MPVTRGAGVELAYDEAGAGPAVLLVHGSAQTRSAWVELRAALGGEVRTIAYDRRGYGESGAPEPYTGTTVEEQSEDAAALVGALGLGPVVACGHSFGAVVCLDLARRHARLVSAAVLVEPPLWSLSAEGAELLGSLRESIEAAARDGGPDAAVDALLEGLAGSGVFGRLGEARLAAARAARRAVFADFAGVNAWELRRRELAAIEAPVVLVRGERSLPIWAEVTGALAAAMPAAEERVLDGGHLVHIEAAADLAAIVTGLAVSSRR